MKEWIVNLFLFVSERIMEDRRVLMQIGACWHFTAGTDQEKMAYLQRQVEKDVRRAKRHPLPESCILVASDGTAKRGMMTYDSFKEFGTQIQMRLLEDVIFCHYEHSPASPLMVVTPVVDGKVRIEGFVDMNGNPTDELTPY